MKHVASVGRHRAEMRPRYGRIVALLASVTVVAIAVLGGLGVVPSGKSDSAAAAAGSGAGSGADDLDLAGQADAATTGDSDAHAEPDADSDPDAPGDAADAAGPVETRAAASRRAGDRAGHDRTTPGKDDRTAPADEALPPASGDGKRVVFSESRQRVWLVRANGTVKRTYLVSGSIYDNLDPGTYEVFSRSRHAVGIDDSGTMEYFVRFTHGDEGAAIGFHTIPVDDGEPVQTEAQLGTPLSHGCIRQRRGDAIRLWKFAPLGATVVVTP